MRATRLSPLVEEETSRFPCKECAYMPGSQTTQSRSHARVCACDRFAFRRSDGVGAPDDAFAAQWLAYTFPCRRFASSLAAGARTAKGRCGSLLLHRSGLAPPTPCRSPGAPDPNLCFVQARTARIDPFTRDGTPFLCDSKRLATTLLRVTLEIHAEKISKAKKLRLNAQQQTLKKLSRT
jgi:hypothetical protein